MGHAELCAPSERPIPVAAAPLCPPLEVLPVLGAMPVAHKHWGPSDRGASPDMPLAGCATLRTWLDLSKPQFSHRQMAVTERCPAHISRALTVRCPWSPEHPATSSGFMWATGTGSSVPPRWT